MNAGGAGEPKERAGMPIWVVGLALGLIAMIPFAPVLLAQFVDFDDLALLIENTRWRGLGPAQLKWMFTSTLLGHYQPLTWVSFAVNYVIGGMNPAGYHLVNVVIHGLNATLVYLLALALIRAAGRRSTSMFDQFGAVLAA